MSLAEDSEQVLERVVEARAGERRPGQVRMTEAVATSIADGSNLVVEAGTGVGKSFAYLIPAVLSGKTVIVSTATKSLQDQLAQRDLPFVAETIRAQGHRFEWAVVKGRASYLCRSRFDEVFEGAPRQRDLFAEPVDDLPDELVQIIEWVELTDSGERDALPFAVADEVWNQLSVSGTECPGKEACPSGRECFAMAALDRASDADVVIVNHHLYGTDLMADGAILPEHDVVIFDEGHRLEDTLASAFGLELAPWRFHQLQRAARFLRGPLGSRRADALMRPVVAAAEVVAGAARRLDARRIDGTDEELSGALVAAAAAVAGLAGATRSATAVSNAQEGARQRLLRLCMHLQADLELAASGHDELVAWCERSGVRLAAVEVGERLAASVSESTSQIVTSATLSVGGSLIPVASALGLSDAEMIRVESPFDFEHQARLYVAAHLPAPNDPEFGDSACDEVTALVRAAGGRALVLTTSHRMVERFAETLASNGEHRLLVQGELSKRALVEEFARDETSVLVATMGFWEGIDVPGRSLELVILDRLPFPRPDDPLWEARRERAQARGQNPFMTVDLPRAAMMAAQGAGRLIRSVHDRGVVALLDSRIARRRYGAVVVGSLPPMLATTDRGEIEQFLARGPG